MLDIKPVANNTMKLEFKKREEMILSRIKTHYSLKFGRDIQDIEAREIADNLLNFTKAIYGT